MTTVVRVIGALLVVGLLVGFYLDGGPAGKDESRPAGAIGLGNSTAVGSSPELPPASSPPTATTQPLADRASASVLAGQTPGEKVGQLAASGRPTLVYEAYTLISRCVRFEENKRLLSATPLTGEMAHVRQLLHASLSSSGFPCEGMTERQKIDRLQYLELAASNGIPGAAIAYLGEGPFGDPHALDARGEDPLVVEWKGRVIGFLRAASERGDTDALAYLSGAYQDDQLISPDFQLALQYEVARRQILSMRGSPPKTDANLSLLKRKLSATQIEEATAVGEKLAHDCCSSTR